MQKILLGIDLCDDYSQVCCMNPLTGQTEALMMSQEEDSCLIPTVIAKTKGEDIWSIGEEAYRQALLGGGVMVDKLVSLAGRGGSATIEDVKYSAEELLYLYVRQLLQRVLEKYDRTRVDSLVFTLQEMKGPMLDLLIRVADRCGIPREDVRIMGHTESFLVYALSQPKDVWINTVCMFDLTEEGLHYYEARVIRGRRPQVIQGHHEKLEEGFSLKVLETPSGEHMADAILTSCADRLLGKKVISAVFLTGKGFARIQWANRFIQRICYKRKVFAGQHVFASGAAYLAGDGQREETAYPFLFLCEGRISADISLMVRYEGRSERLLLAEAGTNWYEARNTVWLIPDDTRTLELLVTRAENSRRDHLRIELDDLPDRPNKTTRLELMIYFTSEQEMTVRITDRGFGELFPASGKVIKRTFTI